MTKDEVLKILGVLNAGYPSNKMEDAHARVYGEMLRDLDYEDCKQAALEWMKSQKWFPSIAELRDVTLVLTKRRFERDERPALPEPQRMTKEEIDAIIDDCRRILRESNGPLVRGLMGSLGSARGRGARTASRAAREPESQSSESSLPEAPPHPRPDP